jgi:hypothetical protein
MSGVLSAGFPPRGPRRFLRRPEALRRCLLAAAWGCPSPAPPAGTRLLDYRFSCDAWRRRNSARQDATLVGCRLILVYAHRAQDFGRATLSLTITHPPVASCFVAGTTDPYATRVRRSRQRRELWKAQLTCERPCDGEPNRTGRAAIFYFFIVLFFFFFFFFIFFFFFFFIFFFFYFLIFFFFFLFFFYFFVFFYFFFIFFFFFSFFFFFFFFFFYFIFKNFFYFLIFFYFFFFF